MTELKSLKSGSDIRGTALGPDAVLTPGIVTRFAAGFAAWCRKTGHPLKTAAIGRDSRISGPSLLAAAADGLRLMGVDVLDFGLCTTPAMFMSLLTDGFRTDASLMITASHQPSAKNGIKFILPTGGVSGHDLDAIIACAEETDLARPDGPAGSLIRKDYLPAYQQILAGRIRTGLGTAEEKPLTGLHIIVDAGNGAGGFYADMLSGLGADVSGSQFLEPDGSFPNHIPNPEDETAMAAVSAATVRSGADLGVIFDTDCDRAAIVDSTGREINRNRLIALISAILLRQSPGASIVTDSVTSSGLARFIAAHGGIHHRFKRGYRNVIDEAVRLNAEGTDCPLAMETSGHAALRENHFLDDGMYLVTVLIVEAMRLKRDGLELASLISDLAEPVESVELRLDILDKDRMAVAGNVFNRITRYAEGRNDLRLAPDNREGIRVQFDLDGRQDSGWLLIRLSVHDPVMPLNIESDVKGGLLYMAQSILNVLEGAQGIDLSNLKHFITRQEEKQHV